MARGGPEMIGIAERGTVTITITITVITTTMTVITTIRTRPVIAVGR